MTVKSGYACVEGGIARFTAMRSPISSITSMMRMPGWLTAVSIASVVLTVTFWASSWASWALLRRSSWGRGYATEAARTALRFAFTEMQQSRVISLIHPANAASIRVAQRLGERQVDAVDVVASEVAGGARRNRG